MALVIMGDGVPAGVSNPSRAETFLIGNAVQYNVYFIAALDPGDKQI
ncbi:MAG: hypothetical protein AAB325_17790 [Pseudomonadota bacterium]